MINTNSGLDLLLGMCSVLLGRLAVETDLRDIIRSRREKLMGYPVALGKGE
jgi:hypothetical protein